MSMDKQSRANGLWLKLVSLLLTIIGVLAAMAWNDLKARQLSTETRVIAVEGKIDTLTQKVDDRLAIMDKKVVMK